MKKTIILLTATLLGALAWTACQKEPLAEETPEPVSSEQQVLTLTLEAAKSTGTKALALETEAGTEYINPYWVTGEKVSVYKDGTFLGRLTAEVNASDRTRATLTGDITVTGLSQGTGLTLLFPGRDDQKWDYTGQDGAAPSATGSLATQYAYARANVTVDTVEGSTVTISGTADFANQQSIYRFSFKSGGSALSIREFTLSSNQNKLVQARSWDSSDWSPTYGTLTVTPGSATSEALYLALHNENTTENDTFSFKVIGSDNALYLGQKTIPAEHLGNEKFVSARNITANKDILTQSSTAVSSTESVW